MPQLLIKIHNEGASDRLDVLATQLRTDLRDTGVGTVRRVELDDAELPSGARGAGSIVGWLTVQIAAVGGFRAVVVAVADWASRSRRAVKIEYGDDSIELSNASAAEQKALIDDFIARHDA
jgi:hypothetical protein